MTSDSRSCNSGPQAIDFVYTKGDNPPPVQTVCFQHEPQYTDSMSSSGSTVSSATSSEQSEEISATPTATGTQGLGTESPSALSVSSNTTTSSHTLLILGSVLGVIAFISLLLLLLYLLLRRRKKQRNNADRESQIPEPYCQEKVPPSQTSQGQDQGEVLRDRARIGDLEETVKLLVNNQHHHPIMGPEIDHQPPPDYASASSSIEGPLQVSRIS